MISGMLRIFRSQNRKQHGTTISRICISAIPLACLLAAGSALAHHSASQYDAAKRVMLIGTLSKVDWRNPHVEVSLEVKDGNGPAKSGWSRPCHLTDS
jgi:hypothetical protein